MTPGSRKPRVARNEGKACDAVVRYIEQRTGEARAAIRRPETEGIGPPVDFRLGIGARECAIEHTQIEPIPGLIRADQEYTQLIGPVIDKVSGTLPGPAVYALHFPIDTHLGVKRADLDRIRRNLIVWIRAKARCLYEGNRDRLEREHKSSRYLDSIEAKPPGFPYPVRLCIRPARSQSKRGTLQAARLDFAEEEREARRANRLREALRRKCRKLRLCKEDGARTVLVLESDDIALTNHVLVGECLAALLPERTDLPNEIYLVETELDSWTVRCMKLDAECWPVDHLAGPGIFHLDDLSDLSKAATTRAPMVSAWIAERGLTSRASKRGRMARRAGRGATGRLRKRPIDVTDQEQHHDPTTFCLRHAHGDERGGLRRTRHRRPVRPVSPGRRNALGRRKSGGRCNTGRPHRGTDPERGRESPSGGRNLRPQGRPVPLHQRQRWPP